MESHGFTKLLVGDLDRSVSFYTAAFGLQEQHRIAMEVAGTQAEEVFLGESPETSTLVLLTFENGPPIVNGEVVIGINTTNSVGEVAERVKAHGGQITTEPTQIDAGGISVEVAMATDPEGHVIEIVRNLALRGAGDVA